MYDYKFSNKLKTFSIALMILGLLGVGYGFMTSHKSFEEVETLLAEEAHHGGGHGEAADHAVADTSHDAQAAKESHAEDAHATDTDAHHTDAHKEHVEHVQHQIANRPVGCIICSGLLLYDDRAWCSGILCNSMGFSIRMVSSPV